MTTHPPARLLDWRGLSKNSLLGFAKVQFSSGLIIAEIAVHRSGGRVWAAPPARPWIEHDAVVLDDRKRPKFQNIIDFATHGVRASWSRQVIAVVREHHPHLFHDADQLSFE